MRQYLDIKEKYSDCIVLCRLGDFYEMFFEDAEIASRELGITLTGKACGLSERAPMCGVPYHALDNYLAKLVAKGYKVAICDQVEDARAAKGIVKREVTRIVSAGTNINMQTLDETKNNYICCIAYFEDSSGVAFCDITTGDFHMTEATTDRQIVDEIARFMPTEIIANPAFMLSNLITELRERQEIMINTLDERFFVEKSCHRTLCDHFHANSINALLLSDFPFATIAAGALLAHLYDTQMTSLTHILRVKPYHSDSFMLLDATARRNLELMETIRDKKKKGSLLWVLDKTKTAMGARALRRYLEQPLRCRQTLEARLDALANLNEKTIIRDEIREYLHLIYDLERLLSKISYRSATPRDLIAFRDSLAMTSPIKTVMGNLDAELLGVYAAELGEHREILGLLEAAIIDEPPLSTKEGGIIKSGFDSEIDQLRMAKSEGRNWLAELEVTERERTTIKNLKVKYNRVFGYYYEVSNANLNLVPEDYQRKQTLVGGERFTNERLRELEEMILGAEEKLNTLEYERFVEVRESIFSVIEDLQQTAKAIAAIDVLANLAFVSEHNRYVRPRLNEEGYINIKKGRHPVVELMMKNELFVSNDTYLDNDEHMIAIVTGPNMAGKSTYMRQTALIVLLAQIGCFVPADDADIGIVDRIFTRVGASDDLASGQSTFMVEMNEVAHILHNATANSLLILDEIGRGTSTYDGLAIAWAVIEHISNRDILGAKTIFATHYHELTELEGKTENVTNLCIAVHERGDDIVFLRKIISGGADRSYGIQVAKLAGVPAAVIERAAMIAAKLSSVADKEERIAGLDTKKDEKQTGIAVEKLTQMTIFDTVEESKIISELNAINVSTLTPLEALNTIYRWQKYVKDE